MVRAVKIGEQLECPVCGKRFKATNDTKYIMKGGYTCSWKCFYNEARIKDDTTKRNKK